MKFIQFIERNSSQRNIIIGIIFILLVNLVLFPLFAHKKGDFSLILDLHFGFSLEEVKRVLSILGEEGRKKYLLSTLLIDTPYAIIYCFVYAFIIARLSKKLSANYKQLLIIIPFFISFFDIIENSGIVLFILNFPDINMFYVLITSFANQLKWIFAGLTLMAVLYLLLVFKIYSRDKLYK